MPWCLNGFIHVNKDWSIYCSRNKEKNHFRLEVGKSQLVNLIVRDEKIGTDKEKSMKITHAVYLPFDVIFILIFNNNCILQIQYLRCFNIVYSNISCKCANITFYPFCYSCCPFRVVMWSLSAQLVIVSSSSR